MNPGPHTLFDIVEQNGEEQFEISVICFEIREPLNHSLTCTYQPLEERTLEDCKEHNDTQVKLLLKFKVEIEKEISQGFDGSKILTQLDYIKNALKHFRNWYDENQISFPDTPTIMLNKIGIFYANSDFSFIRIRNNNYELTESQSKIVKVHYKSANEGVVGLTYSEIANRTGLTSYSRMSSYFQSELRWNDLLKYSKQSR
tara:strand:- start:227 stop:829 length:603 start_codon:yes stop_codon:yes gene_type:complete